MGQIPFGLLEEPETRKSSKVRLTFLLLFVALFVLSITFIALYVVERNTSDESTSKQGQQNGTVNPTTSNTTEKPTQIPTSPSNSNKTCNSPACIISAADILNKLDPSTKPCDDFYQYSCGGFLKKSYIPEDEQLIDSFTKAMDNVQYRLRNILQNKQLMSNYSKDSAVFKAFTFYMSCMNDTSINKAGKQPILSVIEKYGSWNITNNKWSNDSWKLERILGRVLADIEVSAFLALDVKPSFFNTSELFVVIGVGTSGYQQVRVDKERSHSRLLKKTLDVEDSDKHKDYKKFMFTVFKLLGSNASIDQEVNRIDDLESEFMDIQTIFNPNDVKGLKKNIKFMTINELNNFTSYQFNWTLYFEEVLRGTNKSIPSDEKLMIALPNNLKEIIFWLNNQSRSLLANEIIWHIILQLSDALPLEFREAKAKYIKSLPGLTTPRWKACNRFTDISFMFATTLLYVNKHLPKGARKTAGDMFTEIKGQFIDGLEEQKWMDNATRDQARLKLDKMTKWIGFPEFIKDPAKLNKYYEDIQVNESQFLQSSLSILKDRVRKKIDKLDKPPQRSRFSAQGLTPLTVNAFYSPDLNAMTVLVGILQAPFYKEKRLKALNYGSLGMVVGHEITHGFDKQGSEYDENGNIRQWWTNKSHTNFVKRSKCLIDEYNNVTIFGYKVNGTKTLSENIADNGGLKYAYRAYQKWREIHGNEARLPALPFNNDQLFFIGFAQQWCAKFKKEAVKSRMETDTHSLDPVRVRVPLHNFPEFSKAFGCPQPKKTCAVW